MSNLLVGNKPKSKNTTGLMEQYLDKEQGTPSTNNKRQSNVLSPLEEEKGKGKKRL